MYQTGHYGAALIVYAPVAAALLLVGVDSLALVGGVTVVALSRLPDCDTQIARLDHRGITHSVAFAWLAGLAAGGLAVALAALPPSLPTAGPAAVGGFGAVTGLDAISVAPIGAFGFGYLVGSLAVLSHLLADVLTPKGIAPFWPVSSKRYSLSVVWARDPAANAILLVSGVLASLAVIVATGRV